MGNYISCIAIKYLQTNPDFEKDPIWVEHYPQIRYPKKEAWLQSLRAKKIFDPHEVHIFSLITNDVRYHYGYYDYQINNHLGVATDEDKAQSHNCAEDIEHFNHLIQFLMQKCLKRAHDIPLDIADNRILFRDEPHIDVTLREVCKMIYDTKIYNQAVASFEKNVADQQKLT